jgi:uncharacterized protein (TIGR03435 family)
MVSVELSRARQSVPYVPNLAFDVAERFGLKAHWETREGPADRLVPAKGGAKLRAADGEMTPEESKARGGPGGARGLSARG